MGVFLQAGVVDASRRRIEISLGTGPPGGLDHVGVDQNAAQALDAEAFDEAHAAHVGREIVDFGGPFADAMAIGFVADVEAEILNAVEDLVPIGQRLFVDVRIRVNPFSLKWRTKDRR